MDSGTFQGEKENRVKNTHTFLPGSCSGPNVLLISLGTLEIDSSFKCQVMFSSTTCCIAKQVGFVQENKAREIPSPISQLLFLLIFSIFQVYDGGISIWPDVRGKKSPINGCVKIHSQHNCTVEVRNTEKRGICPAREQFSAILMGPGSIFSPPSQVERGPHDKELQTLPGQKIPRPN